MAKSLLIISRSAPGRGLFAREALDIALAGGAYDLPMGILFLDDGVFQLTAQQRPEFVEQKSLSANLQALPLFGVDELFACSASLAERGLGQEDLALGVQVLELEAISPLLNRFDEVITL
jgi:tRNA 2-thiouridine synthesizing protein C